MPLFSRVLCFRNLPHVSGPRPVLGRTRTIALLTALIALGQTVSAHAQRTVAEQYLFQALNATRSTAGLPGLKWSDPLADAARQHADWMRREEVVAHRLAHEPDLPERAAASGERFSTITENIGVSSNAVALQDLWVRSPSHRENMLDPTVNAVGIAVQERGGDLWAVEDFAGTAPELSLSEQELRVSRLLIIDGIHPAVTDDARAMCRISTGYVGIRPAFVMRFNATELTHLPTELERRLKRASVSRAAVGACSYPQGSFAVYSVAVALYR